MYQYRVTLSAMNDLREIAAYITNMLYAPEAARLLLQEVEAAIQKACDFPFALPAVNDTFLQRRGYRKIIVRNYIVFVIPDAEKQTLDVMRVLYHARDYRKEL